MRRFILSLFAVIAAICAFAQQSERMVVEQKDGSTVRFDVTGVNRVYFESDEPTPPGPTPPEPEPEPTPTMEYVDLGLPSGLKWATCNLGASKPEEYGGYYGWGCIKPYKDTDGVLTDITAAFAYYFSYLGGTGTSREDCGTDKDPLKDYVYPNQKSIAGTQWDVARAKLGGNWRMPTLDEQMELKDNCTWTWMSVNGVNGCRVTGPNGSYIFLPAAGVSLGSMSDNVGEQGLYWSSTPEGSKMSSYEQGPTRARCIEFESTNGGVASRGGNFRVFGCPIRAVSE